MKKRLLSLFLAAVLLLTLLPSPVRAEARAAEPAAPSISSITFSETTLAAPGTLTVTLVCHDELSEVTFCQVEFLQPGTNRYLYASGGVHTGDVWSLQVPVGENAPAGDYFINKVSLSDSNGMYMYYGSVSANAYSIGQLLPEKLASLKFSVTNSGVQDTEPPTLTNITLDRTTIDAQKYSQERVSVTVACEDDVTEIVSCQVKFRQAGTTRYLDDHMLKNGSGEWRGHILATMYTPAGDYVIDNVYLCDSTGNEVWYYGDAGSYLGVGWKPLPENLASLKITVTNSGNQDTEPPTLKDIKLDKTSLAAPGSLGLTVFCTDNVNPVMNCQVVFRHPSTDTCLRSEAYSYSLSSSDICEVMGRLYAPDYAPAGDYLIDTVSLTDETGNSILYYRSAGGNSYANGRPLPEKLASLKVTVLGEVEKPTITKQPVNVTASTGGTAVFSVTATGATSYQWQFRKSADGAWANATASGNATATVSVPVTAVKNGYQYRCKVSNAVGTVYTSIVTLTVTSAAKPTITKQPASISTAVGGTATFSVTATGATGYQWQFRKSADGAWANASASGNATATVKVPVTANKNGYQYRCKLSNAAGTVYSSVVTLTVTSAAKPSITKQPVNASAAVGGTAVFSVTATGATSYQWQFRKSADGAWANASASGNATATVKVPVTANKNGYQYRCKVSGAGGTVYSSVVTLTVQSKPTITKQPANASAPVGGTAVFSVTATGATSYQWQFRKSASGAWANAGADGNKTAALNVPVTANKNGYQYRCKVSNAAGTVYTSVVTLTVQSKPVITIQPTNASAPAGGTAVFTITATGAVSYQWQFRKTADGAWANASASGNQTATLSVPAAANKNGYQYRCELFNPVGTVYSSVVTLTVTP